MQLEQRAEFGAADEGPQINVEPVGSRALWKVIIPAIRCPVCSSTRTRALTGKRESGEGLNEHYRTCLACELRFRVVHE
ncbi:MAG: hypothetical protein AAFV43_00570 [Planctomycetota bacterium]